MDPDLPGCKHFSLELRPDGMCDGVGNTFLLDGLVSLVEPAAALAGGSQSSGRRLRPADLPTVSLNDSAHAQASAASVLTIGAPINKAVCTRLVLV